MSIDDGSSITIQDPEFKTVKKIAYTCPVQKSGSYSETATVTPTAAKVSYFSLSSMQPYYNQATGSIENMTAANQTEMIKKLKENHSGYAFVPFTDLNGNVGCYSYYEYNGVIQDTGNFYQYSLFLTSYPEHYYVLKDGYVYSANASYTPVYDESKAEWKKIAGSENTYTNNTDLPSYEYLDYDSQLSTDQSFSVSQTLFNDDDKWEYVCYLYDTEIKIPDSYMQTSGNPDGTVQLTRRVDIRTAYKAIEIRNENGTVIATIDPQVTNSANSYLSGLYIDGIVRFGGKAYAEIHKSIYADGKYTYTTEFYDLNKTVSTSLTKGDMNGDGKIDMQDANIIVNQYLGK